MTPLVIDKLPRFVSVDPFNERIHMGSTKVDFGTGPDLQRREV